MNSSSRWRTFLAASFIAATFLMFGAPWLPMALGIVLAGAWNLYADSKARKVAPVAAARK